jgi:hypothetical protein
MKGDWVEIVVDTGAGTRVYEIAATRPADGSRSRPVVVSSRCPR